MKAIALLLAASLLLAACGIPADPKGTLERVRGGVVRVGMTEAPPWTQVSGGERSGVEVQLVERFAGRLGARIEWTDDSEGELFHRLEQGQLDLVIGGLTTSSPWKKKAAFTRPYATVLSDDGKREKHVMAAHMGENAFLTELDAFLQPREGEIGELLTREGELLALRAPAGGGR